MGRRTALKKTFNYVHVINGKRHSFPSFCQLQGRATHVTLRMTLLKTFKRSIL